MSCGPGNDYLRKLRSVSLKYLESFKRYIGGKTDSQTHRQIHADGLTALCLQLLTASTAIKRAASAISTDRIQCVTLTFAERNRLALSLSGNKPLSAN